MTQEGGKAVSSHGKKEYHRPSLVSQVSTSVPSTPKQHARDMSRARTPSPHRLQGARSPRSVSSESTATMPFLKPTIPNCRFQSTQTSRRRIKYTIGADMLEPEKEEPKKALDSFEQKKLGADLKALYDDLLPSSESQDNREKVVEKLKAILQEEWPDRTIEVSVFGSSGNLLNTNKSDVDICISVRSLETVCSLAELLARRGMKNVTCVHAKAVPIVKIWDPQYQMACDLNVNNHVALKNTRMVRAYMELDDRVRPLALIVKYWTKRRLLNEASGGTLSSYTWTLLVIHFLQTRPVPILPVLAVIDTEGRHRQDFDDDLKQHQAFGKANEETLAGLFFSFFRHYGHEVDYETAVMSVRTGKILTKKEKKWHLATNNRLCVEEPFNTDRNLGNTADDTAFRGLHLEMRQAFSRIAEGKDLVSSICEQYQHPPEEPKPIFERPQPGPRPILSRSTSQSGRGGRRHRGGKGGQDFRNGGNGGRRSSSAAAFGHNIMPGIQSPGLLIPGSEYFFGAGAPMFSAADLETLSRQIDQKQQQLRIQQLQIQQAQLQAQAQAQVQAHNMAANQQRSSSASTPIQQYQRLQSSGYPSPRLHAADMAPGSAPLNPPYPYNTSTESSVPMSHSSSAQDGNTDSNSPMLGPATPHRRGLQRGTPQLSSPGAAVRSQSQPARTMAPNMVPSTGSGRSQYGTPTMQQHFPMAAARPFYLGPYMGPYGSYYLAAPSAESLPREYLGYGIGGAPQFPGAAGDGSQIQFPPYEELLRQGRPLSQSRRHSTMVGPDLQLARSPSPHPYPGLGDPPETTLGSPATSTDVSSVNFDRSASRVVAEDTPPMIVNGSHHTASAVRGGGDQEARRGSEPARRPTFGSEPGASTDEHTIHRTQSNQSFAARIGASIAASEKARKDKLNFIANDDSETENRTTEKGSKGKGPSASQIEMPPPRPSDARAQKTMESQGNNRRQSGGNRAPVMPFDLGISYNGTAERLQQPHLLSPVEERRTPSPASNRNAWHRNSLPLNGIGSNGIASLADAVAQNDRSQLPPLSRLPPPPTPLSNTENASGTGSMNGSSRAPRRSNSPTKGGVGRGRPLSQTFLPSETARLPSQQQSSQANSTNNWQQAGKGKKGRKKVGEGGDRSGGHSMPENVAERKGG